MKFVPAPYAMVMPALCGLLGLAVPAVWAQKSNSGQADDTEVPGSRLKAEDKPGAKPADDPPADDPPPKPKGRARIQTTAPADKATDKATNKAGAPADNPNEELVLPAGMAGKGGGGGAGGVALKMRYQGVAPGRAELPPHPPQLPLNGSQRLTWPGFQVRDGVATVFLQLSGPVEYTVEEHSGALVVLLQDTMVPLRNNLNPLRVEQFHTPVKAVRVQRKKQDRRPLAVITVDVKGEVNHKEQMVQAENGYSMLVMSVTPASDTAKAGEPGEAGEAGATDAAAGGDAPAAKPEAKAEPEKSK